MGIVMLGSLSVFQEMRGFVPAYSPGLSSLPFVLDAMTQHSRCGEVVPLFEEVVSSEVRPYYPFLGSA